MLKTVLAVPKVDPSPTL